MSSRVGHRAVDGSAAEQRLDQLLRTVNAIILEADPLRVTFVGGRVQQILGYAPQQWLSDPDFWANHVHPDDREDAVSRREKAIREGRGRTLTYRMIAADGRAVCFSDSVAVEVEGGIPVRSRTVMIDVTESERAGQQPGRLSEDLDGRSVRPVVRRNQHGLTPRELTILRLMAEGKADKEIACDLLISAQTVSKHVANILGKMEAASRTEASVRALREGLLD